MHAFYELILMLQPVSALKNTKYIFLLFGLTATLFSWAVDASYYSSLNGKKDSELRSALTQLLYNKHTLFSKYNWAFPMDLDDSGNVIDIYTTGCGFTNSSEHTYKCCCDGLNREHVVCQSTFDPDDKAEDNRPQYSDRHHLYLVDGMSNTHRNNHAFGECTSGAHGSCKTASTVIPSEGTSTCSNHELGKLGAITRFADLYESTDQVYEPADEYKGDIARAILYMVVRYAESTYCRLPDNAAYCTSSGGGSIASSHALKTANAYPVTTWKNSSTQNDVGQMFSTSLSTNYGLSAYGRAILLAWHREDPVSQQEIRRNGLVEADQGNRNPFVDYPCLVEYLWGDYTGQNFNTSVAAGSFQTDIFVVGSSNGCSCSTDPMITKPTGTIDFGSTNTSVPLSQTITVQGIHLESGDLTLALSGTNSGLFTLSKISLTKAQAEAGYDITITYTPTANGTHTATLKIYGCGIAQSSAHTITLTGTCATRHTVTWSANGSTYHTNTVANNNRPDIPGSPDDCSATRVFMGWTATSGYSDTTAPADLFTTTAPAVTGNKTFYAVYATATISGTSTDYALFSGELEEGDYILTYYKDDNAAMTASISSNRFAYTTVSPSNNIISNPDASIIWHIAQNEDYWTIYNDGVGKYAGGTTTKNQGALLSSVTDYALWTCDNSSSSTTYDFVNKGRAEGASDTGNKYLHRNGTNGFACYMSSTGGALTLYKKTENIVYSQYSVNCSSASNVTITFHANDGTNTTSTQSIPKNVNIALVDNSFSYAHHSFVNWNTQANGNGTTYANGATVNIDSDLDLYAIWSEDPQYTVTFMNNGVTFATQTNYAGETITGIETPSLTNCDDYTFEGWSTSTYALTNTATPTLVSATTVPASNTTYHAVYSYSQTSGSGGSASLTQLGSSSTFAAGDQIVIVAKGFTYALYQETTNSSYVKNWDFENSAATVAADAKNYVTLSVATNNNWYLGDATNGYLYNSSSNNLACSTTSKTEWTIAWNSTESAFTIVGNGRYLSCRTDLSSSNANLYRMGGTGTTTGIAFFNLYKYVAASSSGTTTYHTTSPDCTTCTATITIKSSDNTKGTVSFE